MEKNLRIYHNTYNEYCICKGEGGMLTYNSSFYKREEAEKFIKDYNAGEHPTDREGLESLFKLLKLKV